MRICELARNRRDVVAIPMGEFGLAGRVLSLRMGSALAYAAVEQATAPGQLSLDAMVDLYRAERNHAPHARVRRDRRSDRAFALAAAAQHRVSRAKIRRGICAVSGSESARFSGRDGADLESRALRSRFRIRKRFCDHLDGCDPLAARIGAVNTVVVRGGGRLYGYNTDYVGVLRSLEQRMRLAGSRVLLFGAGGAARAAAFALAQAGSIVCLCARRPERARALARAVGGQVVARADLAHEFFDAIVNCTPIGMHPHGGSPLASAELNCRIVMDMVYRPRETELLQLARRKGIETISGVEMFLAQGFAQYEIWTGERAPESAMRRAVVSALDREEKFKARRS